MPFAALFHRNSQRDVAARLYGALVERSRSPVFFTACGVPDTFDGRFEMVALHAFLLLHRLKREKGPAADLAQAVFDTMFQDFDRVLREIGVGDLGVGRQVKRMAQGVYGRIVSYERGLASETELSAALRRNLYGTTNPEEAQLVRVAAYLRASAAVLAALPDESLLAGQVAFAALPQVEEASGDDR